MKKTHFKAKLVAIGVIFVTIVIGSLVFWRSDDFFQRNIPPNEFTIIRHGIRPPDNRDYIIIAADGVTGVVSPVHSVTEADRLAAEIIFEPLFKTGRDGLPIPLLARDFHVPDNNTITVYVNSGIYLSNGEAVTMEQLRRSFSYFSRIGGENRFTPYVSRLFGYQEYRMGIASYISGINIDENERSIIFNFTHGGFENTNILLVPVIIDGIGTGAFYFSGVEGDSLILSANNYYHGGTPRLEQIIIRSANVLSAPLLLSQGAADLYISSFNRSLLEQLYPQENLSVGVFDGERLRYIGFNMKHPVLSNRNIREALALSSGHREIIYDMFGDFAKIPDIIVPGYMFLAWDVESDTNIHDLQRAAELLHEEGFEKNIHGILEREGETLSFVIYAPNTEEHLHIVESIADSWRELGIDAVGQVVSFAYMRYVMETGGFDMLYLDMAVNPNMNLGLLTSPNPFLNPFRWENEEAAELVRDIRALPPEQAMENFNNWLNIYKEEFVHIHTDKLRRLVFFNPNLQNLDFYNFGSPVWNVSQWYLSH